MSRSDNPKWEHPRCGVDAKAELWRRGQLSWKLRPAQRVIYDYFWSTTDQQLVISAHRGAGKSFLCSLIAFETALRTPNTQIKYISPSQKMTRLIALPNFQQLLADCPADIVPKYHHLNSQYRFQNGSTILMAGAELNNADTLRGTDTHLAIFDEEAFFTNPEYIVNSVILPRAIPVNGKLIHISTPPTSILHPFSNTILSAERAGKLFKVTADNNPYLSKEILAAYERESGGRHTTTFRREYLCELISDSSRTVFPQFSTGQDVLPISTEPTSGRHFCGIFFDPKGRSSAAIALRSDGKLHVLDSFSQANVSPITFARTVAQKLPENSTVFAYGIDEPTRMMLGQQCKLYTWVKPFDVYKQGLSAIDVYLPTISFHDPQDESKLHIENATWNEQRTAFDRIQGNEFGHLWTLGLICAFSYDQRDRFPFDLSKLF